MVDRADSDGDGILDGADDDGYSNAVEAAAATDATSPFSHPDVEADEVVPTPIPTAVDTDGDGYRDGRDQFMTSPTNPDSDRDGLSDGFEQLTRGVSSYRADSDYDGVLDGDEDADGDGYSNCVEAAAGSNANVAADVPADPTTVCPTGIPKTPDNSDIIEPVCPSATGLVEGPEPAVDPRVRELSPQWPPPPLARPAAGETFCEPTFGTRITALPDGWRHVYSQLQAFSSDNEYVIVIEPETEEQGVLSMSTMTVAPLPAGARNPVWLPNEDHVLFQKVAEIGLRPSAEVWTFDPANNVETMRAELPYDDVSSDSWETPSRDGKYVAIYGVNNGADDNDEIAVFDLTSNAIISRIATADLPTPGTEPIDDRVDWVAVTPDGAALAVQFKASGAGHGQGFELYNFVGATAGSPVQPMLEIHDHTAHSDMGIDGQGATYLLTNERDWPFAGPMPEDDDGLEGNDPTLVKYDLSTGVGEQVLISEDNRVVHISTQGDEGEAAAVWFDWDTNNAVLPMRSEVWLVGSDGRTQRLAHHRTDLDYGDEEDLRYLNQAHASISRDGTKVIFVSNWNGTAPRTGYVIDVESIVNMDG